MPFKPLTTSKYEQYIKSAGWKLEKVKLTGTYTMKVEILFVRLKFLMEKILKKKLFQ